METIVRYFGSIPSAHRSAFLLGGLTFFLLLEYGLPYYRSKYNKRKHFGVNVFFTATTIIINFLMAFILLKSSDWALSHSFGILQWLPDMPLTLFVLTGLLLLDFIGAYLVHWAQHNVQWMWRFHLIHHTDPNVDTTTANRHHPIESVFRFTFTTLGAVISGSPMYLIMLYQTLSALLSQFNHSNIQLPPWFERMVGWVLVTPGIHRVHHHYMLPYTDKNYGNIFSFWDRLLGTFSTLDNDKIVFGIDTHQDTLDQSNIGTMLKIPFNPFRHPDGAKFES
jgi:sterol desaturase/sphingolipid hydroxylase (fatty acid hydroxylase superfamily)